MLSTGFVSRVKQPHGDAWVYKTILVLVLMAGLWVVPTAVAGPNVGGVLLLHTDNTIAFTTDEDYRGLSGPYTPCSDNVIGECPDPPFDGCGCDWVSSTLVTASTRPLTEASVVWLLAAFPPENCAEVVGVSFGITWPNQGDLTIGVAGNSADFEVPQTGWPGRDLGNAIVFATPQYGEVIELYWFAIYAYYETTMTLRGNPTQGDRAEFGDNSTPSQTDEVAGFGSMGFGGASGSVPDFGCGVAVGACCVDGTCSVTTESTCLVQGGVYLGDGILCDPNPCPVPDISVSPTSLSASLNAGETETQLLSVGNLGEANLVFSVFLIGTPAWLDVQPRDGSVAPADITELDVIFDATSVTQGLYEATVRLVSNDPDEPEVDVSVTLEVTGVPDIEVSATSLDFGPVFIGVPQVAPLEISNVGTADLQILALAASQPQFSAPPDPFSIAPGESQSVGVTFAPTVEGPTSAVLRVRSSDPDEPVTRINLSGEGVVPPTIAVDPDSIAATLFTDELLETPLLIQNTGGQVLDFSIELQVSTSALRPYVLTPGPVLAIDPDDPESGLQELELRAERSHDLKRVDGLRVLYDLSISQPSGSNASVLISDLVARGAAVDESFNQVTTELLADYDVFWSAEAGFSSGWNEVALSALQSFLEGGGAILLEGDNSSSTTAFNELLSRLGSGITHSTLNGMFGTTTMLFPHPTTDGLTSLYVDPGASLSGVNDPAMTVVADASGTPMVAVEAIGSGKLVVCADELFADFMISQAQNQEFGNQVFDWLAGPGWVSISDTEGTIPAGGERSLVVTLDATDLFDGLYEGEFRIFSNDPVNPVVNVPVALDVIGVPRLEVEPLALNFGDVFIGSTSTLSILVANGGTADLSITGVGVSPGPFSTPGDPLLLAPFESEEIEVDFVPLSPEFSTASLGFSTNDPDVPEVAIVLSGSGIFPPVPELLPMALEFRLTEGGNTGAQLTLANVGDETNAPLQWILEEEDLNLARLEVIEELAGSAPAEPRGGEPRDMGGPDGFGYTWIDSDAPGGPTFDWREISSVGTQVFPTESVALPFPLPFYELEVTTVNITSTGFLSFTGGGSDSFNDPIPSTSFPNGFAAPWWDSQSTGSIYWYHDTLRNEFVVQYTQMSSQYTYQVILRPNGTLFFQYLTMGSPTSGTVGIEDPSGQLGLQMAYNEPYVHDGLAVRIDPPGCIWLDAAPTAGIVLPGDAATIEVEIDASSLEPGVYLCTLHFTTNVPETPSLAVPVQLNVDPLPPQPNCLTTTPTGLPYTIVVEQGDKLGRPLAPGDEIGIFDIVAGEEICVGFGVVESGASFPLAITAWQADPVHGVPGFIPGNPIRFELCPEDGTPLCGRPEFRQGGTFGEGSFSVATVSFVECECAVACDVRGGRWEWIGLGVRPFDTDAASVFASLEDLEIAQNDEGDAYIPGVLDNLSPVSVVDGFEIYLDGPDDQFELLGELPYLEADCITLEAGQWNLVPYLSGRCDPACRDDVTVAMAEIASCVEIVLDGDGRVWIPEFGINTLGELDPCRAYRVFLDCVDDRIAGMLPPPVKRPPEPDGGKPTTAAEEDAAEADDGERNGGGPSVEIDRLVLRIRQVSIRDYGRGGKEPLSADVELDRELTYDDLDSIDDLRRRLRKDAEEIVDSFMIY